MCGSVSSPGRASCVWRRVVPWEGELCVEACRHTVLPPWVGKGWECKLAYVSPLVDRRGRLFKMLGRYS